VLSVTVLSVLVYLNISDILVKHYGLPGINKTLIPALLLLVIYYQIRSGWKTTGLQIAVVVALIYYSFQASTVFYTRYPDMTELGVSILLKNVIIMVTICGLILRVGLLKYISWSLLISAAFISLLSTLAFIADDPSVTFGGLHRWKVEFNAWGRMNSARVGGQLGDPNFYGQVLLLILPVGLMFAFNGSSRLEKWIAGLLSLTIISAIVTTLSRGSWLMLIAMLIVFVSVLYYRYGRTNPTLRGGMLAIAAAAVLSTVFLPDQIKDRFTGLLENVQQYYTEGSIPDQAISGRLDEMLGAIYAFSEYPVLGLGYNNYKASYQDYSRREGLKARGRDRSAHSLYLQLLAEGGIVGLLLFLSVVYITIRCALHAAKRLAAHGLMDEVYYIHGLLYGYIAYLAAALFLHTSFERYFWFITGILIATLNLIPTTSVNRSAPIRGVAKKESMA